MPRRAILSPAERESLLAFPETGEEMIRHYTFSESDLSIIRQHRGAGNRLGFAVQLCYMRYPGVSLGAEEIPFAPLLHLAASQLRVPIEAWEDYGQRDQTRREHQGELQSVFGFQSFTLQHYRSALQELTDLALQTDKGILLATALITSLRTRLILLPSIGVIERICAEAVTHGNRRTYHLLTESLKDSHHTALNDLLKPQKNSKITTMAWLRQSPGASNSKHLLNHLDRLNVLQALNLPEGIERQVHQNRLLKIAREGRQMTPGDLAKFETERRYATLVAVALEAKATLIDEIIDLHDRIIGSLFNRAKRSHEQKFQQSSKEINEKVRLFYKIGNALLTAKQAGADPFAAIESIIPWDVFAQNVTEAQQLAQTEDFDYLSRISEGYPQIRRYAPTFLNALSMRATPAAQDILTAVEILKTLYSGQVRKIPKEAPRSFIKKRWENLVFTEAGIDRRFYELCTLSELKNALRSGDVWIQGSRQFKDFEEYLLPTDKFTALLHSGELPLAVVSDGEQYLSDRLKLLSEQLATVNRLAKAGELPDAIVTDSGLKITPLTSSIPEEADALMRKAYSLLPPVKITELLMEVDEWTGFTHHFTHIKNGEVASDRMLLLTAILADAINLGLTNHLKTLTCRPDTLGKYAHP